MEVQEVKGDLESKRVAPLFVAHGGGPLPLLGDSSHTEMVQNFKLLSKKITKPKAIVVISAHWEESEFTLLETPSPQLFFDYYGFPEESYQYKYPAPLATDVNIKIKQIFKEAGLTLNSENKRGYDHGVFVPLILLYPEADIPITQISLKSNLNPKSHYQLGVILSKLSDEGILIFTSGMSYHGSFGRTNLSDNITYHEYLKNALTVEESLENRLDLIINWNKTKEAKKCHPREEHLIPLHVAFGAAKGGKALLQEYQIMGYKVFNAIFSD